MRSMQSFYDQKKNFVHISSTKMSSLSSGWTPPGLTLISDPICGCTGFFYSRGEEGVWFGNQWVSSMLFMNDVVLLEFASHDLQVCSTS